MEDQVASPTTPRINARRRLPIRSSAKLIHFDDIDVIPDPSSEIWISPTALSNADSLQSHVKQPSPVIIGTPSTGNRLRAQFNTPERPSSRVNFADRLKQVVDTDDEYLNTHSFLPTKNNHLTQEATAEHDDDSTSEQSQQDDETNQQQKENQGDGVSYKDLRLLDVEVVVPIDACNDQSSEKELNDDNDTIPLLPPPDQELSDLIQDNIEDGWIVHDTPVSEISVIGNNKRRSLTELPSNSYGLENPPLHQHAQLSTTYPGDHCSTSLTVSDKWVVEKNSSTSQRAIANSLTTKNSHVQSHLTAKDHAKDQNANPPHRWPTQMEVFHVSERVARILKKRKGPIRPAKHPWKKRTRSYFRVQQC